MQKRIIMLKSILKTILATGLLITLCGCYVWPQHGTGGVAELYYSPFMPYKQSFKKQITHEHMLQLRLMLARDYLDRLAADGARACFPGLWRIADIQANRTTRELVGGLYHDAYNDLRILESQVNDLKQRLAYEHEHGVCLRSPIKRSYKTMRSEKKSKKQTSIYYK